MNYMETLKFIRNIVRSITPLVALILIPAACSDEQMNSRNPEQQPGTSGPLITVTANQEDRPQTRLGYNDPVDITKPIEVTWAAQDQFFVGKDWSEFAGDDNHLSAATGYFSSFDLEKGAGAKNADFIGKLPTEMPNGSALYAIYGDGTNRIAIDKEEAGALSFDYTNQRQSANADTKHLSAVDFMAATTTYETDQQPVFNFTHLGAMIKFSLTLPEAGMTVKQLTLTTTDGTAPFSSSAQWKKDVVDAFSKSKTASAGTTLLLGEDETGITLTDTKELTAYMMVAPTSLTDVVMIDKKFLLKVTDANGVVYAATFTGGGLEQGKYYTVQAELVQLFNEMKFDIKVESGSLDFRIPFPTSGNTPADIDITVDWGDGKEVTMVPGGTALSSADGFKHPYTDANTYTITITSSQIDATKQQIPRIKFDGNSDAKKLISMNTPILNIGTYYFSYCFKGCTNLTSLSPGLFDKNTQADDFGDCFTGCTSLTELPPGLFDKNTQADDFGYCFDGCTNLTSLPQGLFDKNTKVTDFDSCFRGCKSLTELPKGLFDNNKDVTNFSSCFGLCDNLASLPEGLFDKNTAVTNFSRCFRYCANLVLNETIFSAATPDAKKTRFSDKAMNFSSCFLETGSNLTNDQQLKSAAPRLWEYEQGTATWTTTDCYKNCKANNLEDIPDTSKWGTPAAAPDKGSSLGDRENITWK